MFKPMKDPNKNIKDLAVPSTDVNWLKELHEMNSGQDWMEKSAEIALKILDVLDDLGWNKSRLAGAMGVSAQQVSKIMKGQENLKLETVCKIEKALGQNILTILQKDEEVVRKGTWEFKNATPAKISTPLSKIDMGIYENLKNNKSESSYAKGA